MHKTPTPTESNLSVKNALGGRRVYKNPSLVSWRSVCQPRADGSMAVQLPASLLSFKHQDSNQHLPDSRAYEPSFNPRISEVNCPHTKDQNTLHLLYPGLLQRMTTNEHKRSLCCPSA